MEALLPRRAHVLTFLNLKGGVGKTHTAWLLASVCQERSLRLLAVDTDTQANFTGSFLPERDNRPGVEALFHPGAESTAAALIRPVLTESRAHLLETLTRFGDKDLGAISESFKERGLALVDILHILAWHEPHHQGQAHITLNLWKVAHPEPAPQS